MKISGIYILTWLLTVPVLSQAQEPGVPAVLHTLEGFSTDRLLSDSAAPVQISAGFFHTLSYTQFDKEGKWNDAGDKTDLSRSALFVSVKRSLGNHLAVGFCLPWYKTNLRYTGDLYTPGRFEVEQFSDIRLFIQFHFVTQRILFSAEGGTNIPVGNGLSEALYPAFPPGENGYLTFWGRTGIRIAFTGQWQLYGSVSYDISAPRSGAVIENDGAKLLSGGQYSVIQATINPGDRISFTGGLGRKISLYRLSLGYTFLYQFSTTAQHIFPETETISENISNLLQQRSVLHTVHAGCFRSWDDIEAGIIIQGAVGGFRSWGELLTSAMISYNFK